MNKPWNIKNTRVYRNGASFNCINKVTAQQLYTILTNYENAEKNKETYEKLRKQIIALQMDLKIVQNDLDKIKELLK